jgi:hypothetical protein
MEGYKSPFSERDKKMMKPRAYEYVKLPGLDRLMEESSQVQENIPVWGILLLAFLGMFNNLSSPEGSDIQGQK